MAVEEALRLEESKKKPQNLEEAIDFILREKLEEFKQSFFDGFVSEQKRLFEKIQLIETSVNASENKPKKRS